MALPRPRKERWRYPGALLPPMPCPPHCHPPAARAQSGFSLREAAFWDVHQKAWDHITWGLAEEGKSLVFYSPPEVIPGLLQWDYSSAIKTPRAPLSSPRRLLQSP